MIWGMLSGVLPSLRSLPLRTTAVAAVVVGAFGVAPAVQAKGTILPLGDADLVESRTVEQVAPGVTLTRMTRGDKPAPAGKINNTPRGPWRVNVLTIDPRRTHGQLQATHGPNLAATETTSALVRFAGATAGVNASFFTFTANTQYPGDPVGLSVADGKVLSEPTDNPAEVHLLVDATKNKVTLGKFGWKGTVRNPRTEDELPLKYLNHPPVVPSSCATLTDQTQCEVPGDVVRFTRDFAAVTPSGPGAETVLDRHGCVVRTASTRGTTLAEGQTALQATGSETLALRRVVEGCVEHDDILRSQTGTQIRLRAGLFGVTGRYRLLAGGKIVVPEGSSSFFARNPRTIAGTKRDGTIMLATIDGRSTTSVGTTLAETAAVAEAIGLRDAINLDGGGSTTMSVHGTLINHPSSGTERRVGDALVFVKTP